MKVAYAVCLALGSLLLGWAPSLAAELPRGTLEVYDPATTARIRVFGGHGYSVRTAPDAACFKDAKPGFIAVKIPGDPKDWLIPTRKNGSFMGTPLFGKDQSIGMRPSISSARTDGHPFFYIEYVVPAGKPIVFVSSYYGGGGQQQVGNMVFISPILACPSIANRVVLEAGKDYELTNGYAGGSCNPTFVLLPDDSGPTSEGLKIDAPKVPACDD